MVMRACRRVSEVQQVLLICLALLAPGISYADCDTQAPSLLIPVCSSCGGVGQRACCNGDGELASSGGACNTGLVAVSGPTSSCSDGIITSETTSQVCVQPTSCGADGQRACCNGTGEYSNNGLACNSGLIQIPGCIGNCACSTIPSESSNGMCIQPGASCGGKGQRACCVGTLEYASNNGASACESGLIEVPGCAGDCTCGGTTATGELAISSCTVIETIAEPLTNSTTPGPNETGPAGTWTFTPVTPSSSANDPECPPAGLCGFADMHVHMFSNLGHGGAGIAGEAWDANGINTALAEDYSSSLNLVVGQYQLGVSQNAPGYPNIPEPVVDGTNGPVAECPGFLLNSPLGNLCSGQVLYHGDHTAFDSVVGGGSNDGASSNLGAPLFNGWPLWSSTIHQQVYWKWLERAWQGGMRLMVMHAVSNETFCKTNSHVNGADCTIPMTFIDNQLNTAVAFQRWLDAQYGVTGSQGWTNAGCQISDPNCYATQNGGPGPGWFQIVTTPQQATSVIQQGKLAVVLGIEVDNLFNCHFGSDTSSGPLNGEGPVCTEAYVLQQLQAYYNRGVRHIFPIHDFDNGFGNTATWQDALNDGNFIEEGTFWSADNCPTVTSCAGSGCSSAQYGFSLSTLLDFLETFIATGIYTAPSYPPFFTGSCHAIPGLTGLGQYLVQQAMQMGMIIDVDHMSINAFNDTIQLALFGRNGAAYPGITAGHVLFFDLYQQQYSGLAGRHERMRTLQQINSIQNLGGMLALITKDDVQDTGLGFCRPEASCPFGAGGGPGGSYTVNYNGMNNNCRYSTTEWAQSYMYGANNMRGPVAIGSDFNGVAGHLGPRFGSDACGGSISERVGQEQANNRLVYPFSIGSFGTFKNQVTGQRTFDYNVDGLAHIGLIPDMIADLQQVGITATQLQPLFGSAQAYVTMWTKTQPPTMPPTITSGGATTFTVGTAGSFPVTATGLPVPTFSETGTLPGGVMLSSNGTLSGTPNANTGGVYGITISAANGVQPNATQSFTLTIDQAPAITSGNATTFTAGTLDSFAATATGFPAPTFSETGALPNGVMLDPNLGTLSGLPAAGTGGVYNFTITAQNGVGPGATQSFTLTVDQAPAITSGNGVTSATGQPVSFTVTATGYPAPTFNQSGVLPNSVMLNPTSGALTGTPAAGTGGTYTITITAGNGVSPNATQSFTLTVDQSPAITSTSGTTFTTGATGSFAVMATGYPAPTFSEGGALPNGVMLNPATGVLSGKPAAGTGGVYPIAITANDGTLPNATQSFTLIVDQPPGIISANAATFTTGLPGSFTVMATGYPASTFSESGALPNGVMLNPTTGALTGAPAAGTGGLYPVTITAGNGILPNATQAFTLTVDQPPAITSISSATFDSGSTSSFTVTTTGYPPSAFTKTGALPTGVTFTDNGNGTATMSGNPTVSGLFTITIAATNVAGQATQSFTLTAALPFPTSGTACNGIYFSTFKGNITLSTGQSCTFISGGVSGNVTENGGSVSLSSATIGGSFTENGGSLSIVASTVTGNVQINGGTYAIAPASVIKGNLQIQNTPSSTAMNQVCGATIKGDLQFQNNGTGLLLGSGTPACSGNSITGNLQVQSNKAPTDIYGNTVGINLQVQSNTGQTSIFGNTVGGNLQDLSNTTSTQVFNNKVANILQCQSNTTITGGGNTAAQKQGQCSAF